jgi:molybdenum cofactor cytidylyltransferase
MPRIGVIVLAAGRSSRFVSHGSSKVVALVDGIPLVRRAVIAAVEADVGDVVVVTGASSAEVGATVADLRVHLVNAPRFADGMAYSLRRGIDAVHDTDAAIIALGDQPNLRPEAYRRVVERWRASHVPIIVSRYAGSRVPAHPVLFASAIHPELLTLDGDIGARFVIARDPARVAEEVLEWPGPRDVDTVDELEALAGRTS